MIDVREMIRSARTWARDAINSSVMPSAKYSCSTSPDMFSSGSTAIEVMRRSWAPRAGSPTASRRSSPASSPAV
jgi:hypothetical protein